MKAIYSFSSNLYNIYYVYVALIVLQLVKLLHNVCALWVKQLMVNHWKCEILQADTLRNQNRITKWAKGPKIHVHQVVLIIWLNAHEGFFYSYSIWSKLHSALLWLFFVAGNCADPLCFQVTLWYHWIKFCLKLQHIHTIKTN